MVKTSYEKVGFREQIEYADSSRWSPLTGDFRINAFAVHERMPPVIVNRPAGTGDWLFMLFHDPVDIRVSGKIETVLPGTLMMWPCGAAHWYGNQTLSWDHSWIHFTGEWAAKRTRECRLDQEEFLLLRSPAVFTDCLWELYAELTGHRQPDLVILKNLFYNGLRGLMRDTDENSSFFIPEPVRQVKQYLDQHTQEKVTLHRLAAMAGISVPHLSAEFKRCYADSPINYLIRQRLQQARYLLLNRGLSISEIAMKVGYEDIFHFSKLFKKHFGKSPQAVRNQFTD